MTKPTPAEAAILRAALSIHATAQPPKDIRSARTRWLTCGDSTERRATIADMTRRGWLHPAVRAGAPAAVAELWIVTQAGLDALHRAEVV